MGTNKAEKFTIIWAVLNINFDVYQNKIKFHLSGKNKIRAVVILF
jgi:hypothetical protein